MIIDYQHEKGDQLENHIQNRDKIWLALIRVMQGRHGTRFLGRNERKAVAMAIAKRKFPKR